MQSSAGCAIRDATAGRFQSKAGPRLGCEAEAAMTVAAELLFDEPKQFAFLAAPTVVRAFVPAGMPGVYMLLRAYAPFYVGRSDKCVQTRLANHPMLSLATHVAWEPCANALHAYRLESAWFHALQFSTQLTTRIHPAHPTREASNCPFCSTGDGLAWTHAVRPGQVNSAVPKVAADQQAVAAKTNGA
jgi:hypothetical protein